MRHVGNPHQAEEIAQAVFIILARKAKGLRHDKALSSWLFQTTRLTATNFVRSESRRHRREQEAQMESLSNAPDNEVWRQIAPLLDAAVASLNARDRRAIVLRFYEGRDLREVGAALGATEEAAKKRVARAVEKLQAYFQKRGVDSTAEAIANSIAANSIQIAPAALAKSVIAVAAAKGAAASTSTLTLVKGALKIMAWTKAKTAISLGAGVLLVVSLTWILPKWVREWRESKISFEAEGRLDQFNDGKLTAQYQFAVFISGNRWLIHNVAPPSDAGIKYFEDSFDGTDVYQYIQLSSAPAGVMNSSIGVVTRNNIPSDRSAYATPIWLAYGSSRYFDEIVSNKAKPFFLWGITAFDKEHYPFIKIQWKRSEEPPYVPTNVYCSELNRRYRALQFTNFDGLYVPSEFVVESFSIGDHSMTNS
ncbi:MAG TPA: sigma-70 family RNA polymerase sigma factor, partial [Verrucomicrobiae bacterium]|nr:sigma-70 family RNA polymerase sigma factor [Verrucomicrobiae bacterium]